MGGRPPPDNSEVLALHFAPWEVTNRPGSAPSALQEFEVIEANDALHDFGGGHGNKGRDFASFWVILRLTELEAQKPLDYVFVCEHMQDVAEFDSSTQPTRVKLYQLKNKEDGYWNASTLTGQTGKSKAPPSGARTTSGHVCRLACVGHHIDVLASRRTRRERLRL